MLRILWLAGAAAGAVAAQGLFETQEIAKDLGVVYAVTTGDVNGDGKTDIIALSATQLLWFENPGWNRHVVIEKVTEKDNVCVAPYDVDGDGKLDFALGADWQPANTAGGGSLHWVSFSGKAVNLATEPTLHRIRWGDVDGDRRPELVVVPLHGRGAKPPEWGGTPGARILVFHLPKNPEAGAWPVEVADESLHIAHNFIIVGREIWVASVEGVTALRRRGAGRWTKRTIAEGKPGEIKLGRTGGKRVLATIEPWHGNSIVLLEEAAPLWKRQSIEADLNQGHALGWGDFDGDGNDELAAGWRGKPWGLALYKLTGGGTWTKTPLDDGVAVEDLAVADLNRDGKPEIVAGGRATQNLRIYWNRSR
ncbi:MAG: VCBS repeat-containing protein [Bryobacterales bacterium]|nr:VCBS repeat-containing protein [Bryobacterales bacterium]